MVLRMEKRDSFTKSQHLHKVSVMVVAKWWNPNVTFSLLGLEVGGWACVQRARRWVWGARFSKALPHRGPSLSRAAPGVWDTLFPVSSHRQPKP